MVDAFAPARLGPVGRRFLPSYPFEEAYLLPYARQFRAALQMPLICSAASTGGRPSSGPWRRASTSWRSGEIHGALGPDGIDEVIALATALR